MAVSVNQILANTLGLADPLGRVADDGRVGFNGRVNINGRPIRFAPNFDGVDDYGVLANKAINPDGDIDIEFETGSIVPAAGGGIEYTVLSQCLTSTFENKEFNLYFNSTNGALQMQVGGSYAPSNVAVSLAPNTKYRALLQGTSLRFFRNGQSLFSASFTRGAAREPTAQTVIMASTHGSSTTFRAFGRGIFFNIRINGTLWRMADRNQTIQLPEPIGLGAELITPTVLENPAVKGSQWTYLGAGRWQYVGDGTLNVLQFIAPANQPAAGYIEFEVESVSGTCTAAANNMAANFNTTGIKRYFYTSAGASNSNLIEFKRASGTASCIIKNISFKPLAVVNATELVANGDFSAGTTGWSTTQGGSISVTGGQATLTTVAGQISRFERGVTLEANTYYEVSMQLISLSGNTAATLLLSRNAAGSYALIGRTQTAVLGRMSFIILAPATDALIQIRGDESSAGTVVVDNVSIRKLDSLCNPMTLVNVTSDRWQEVPQ